MTRGTVATRGTEGKEKTDNHLMAGARENTVRRFKIVITGKTTDVTCAETRATKAKEKTTWTRGTTDPQGPGMTPAR